MENSATTFEKKIGEELEQPERIQENSKEVGNLNIFYMADLENKAT